MQPSFETLGVTIPKPEQREQDKKKGEEIKANLLKEQQQARQDANRGNQPSPQTVVVKEQSACCVVF